MPDIPTEDFVLSLTKASLRWLSLKCLIRIASDPQHNKKPSHKDSERKLGIAARDII